MGSLSSTGCVCSIPTTMYCVSNCLFLPLWQAKVSLEQMVAQLQRRLEGSEADLEVGDEVLQLYISTRH